MRRGRLSSSSPLPPRRFLSIIAAMGESAFREFNCSDPESFRDALYKLYANASNGECPIKIDTTSKWFSFGCSFIKN